MRRLIPAAFGLVLFLGSHALGQGVIFPRECHQCPPPRPIPRPIPIPRVLDVESVKLTVKIDSQVATTTVEQVFRNDTPYTLEGTFFFPIPESASVSGFAIFDGDRRMSAEVMDREQARRIYNEIVRKMIDPGLLEYAGKNLFQARVFPIPARGKKKIELVYSQVLKSEGGTVAYRYELGSGRRINPKSPERIAAAVEIASSIDLKNIYSPTHKLAVNRHGEKRARASFEGSGAEAQRDFHLYYSLSNRDFGLALLTHREPGKDGYFLMLISPKMSIGESQRIAKDVVFVFDTSGSMSGDKIEKARAALRFGVESLSDRDRFNIISFSGEEHLMSAALSDASAENKKRGVAFAEGLRAEGGTNINDALVAAFKQFPSGSSRPGMIVFMTDGLPTVGTTNTGDIVKNVKGAAPDGVRLFSFGVGYDVNTSLLDTLAGNHRGTSDYVEPEEDLEVKVSNFFAKVNYPVLSDLKLDFGGVEVDASYPRPLPDLFKGSQLTIVGRYKSSSERCTIRLTGAAGDGSHNFAFEGQRFPSETRDNAFVPRLWATRRVGYLLEQIRLNGENKELVDEVRSLGTRFGIVTPYTSFLVTEDMKDLARRGVSRDDGRMLSNMAQAPGAAGGAGRAAVSGESAVVRSRAEARMKEADAAPMYETVLSNLSVIKGKTFILKDGVWTDSEYSADTALPVTEVAFGSDEYFALVAREPDLGEYFALGRKVVVVLRQRVYKVL